jgi:hypothetical protein
MNRMDVPELKFEMTPEGLGLFARAVRISARLTSKLKKPSMFWKLELSPTLGAVTLSLSAASVPVLGSDVEFTCLQSKFGLKPVVVKSAVDPVWAPRLVLLGPVKQVVLPLGHAG